MDYLVLSRIQFAANMTFHILFPTITIALCWLLLFFRVRHMATRGTPDAAAWEQAYYFWTKVFALTFALGVVSGITMSFQFGTNWPGFMEKTGNIAGPLLGYEVLTAFFLEATFLGIMLFGRGRVSERVHLIATFLVAFGTTMSAFWILSLNSWMQTPTGYEIINGEFHALSWWDIVFNPSFPYRLTHKLLASALTASFLMAGISAWQIIRRTATPGTHKALRTAVIAAAIAIPLQIMAGDMHGLNTLQHQPAKIAAIEGIWHTETGAPLTLFGWPSEKEGRTLYALQIPKGASLILAHDANATLRGLDEFKGEHPPVAPVFWGFRIMVGMGMLMLLVSWWGAFTLWRGRKVTSVRAEPVKALPTSGERHQKPSTSSGRTALVGTPAQAVGGTTTEVRFPRLFLYVLAAMTFSGWLATLAGWYVTEIGRQPWIVYGLLKTADVVATHPPKMVLGTLIAYLSLYALLLASYIGVLKYMAEHPEKPAPEAPAPIATTAPTTAA
ncbi:MAG: cytochrome ubiquinol oxidase subunit I [Burkholderiales bacterium]|nr:MAG: cytochrome ubiquinol oxidase subunit I [Burkholderiales bacterium]